LTKARFSGVLAPVITPFDNNLMPDKDIYVRHCHWLTEQQVGLAVFGTNSEANSLSLEEKSTLLAALIEGGIDPMRLMPGTGSCALPDAIQLTRFAVESGCAGVLMLPPFYYKGVSDDGLYQFYSEVIQRIADPALQIYLYHIPQVTQIPLSIDLIDRLVKAYPDNIAGVKDSSGDWSNTQAMLDRQWPDFRVFCGSESFLLQNMRAGGAGCISATANVNPAAIYSLYANWQESTADEKQAELNTIRDIFQSRPMIPALKSATALCARIPDWHRVRPPLMQLNQDMLKELETALDAAYFNMPGLAD